MAIVIGILIFFYERPLFNGLRDAAVSLMVLGIFGGILYAITKANLWWGLCCLGLCISGAGFFLWGLLAFASIGGGKDATVFQEYEAIFFTIGGLVVLALGLILTAILALKKAIAKEYLRQSNAL